MHQSTPHPAAAGAMTILERALYCALPTAALAAVGWLITHAQLPLAGRIAWIPALGVDLAWRIDGLSVLMLLMITGVGSAVFVYAGEYLAGHAGQRRLYALLSVFMVAMIGCVVADDLLVLFVFWEMTSVLSFLLVGFEHERADSRRAAQQAMLVTGGGGLALLAGFLLLAQEMGTSSISAIVEGLPTAPHTQGLAAALLLVLVGAFTKSAQFPFHFWLPNAMSAPTPVSAYLHSATMVKLGVYLLGRFDPGFGDWDLWVWSLKISGSITAAWAMLLALRERDLKRILAWSTVATLGTLVMLVGLRGDGATVAVGALLLAHALYKAPLFFVAGNLDHGTGTRLIDRLGNLRHAMPWTATAAALAGLSMAGMPLSFGYIVKDVILEVKSAQDVVLFASVANTVFGAVAVAVAAVAAIRVFWHHPGDNVTPEAHEGGWALVLPPLVLACLGILLGVAPILAQDLVAGASMAMTAGDEPAAMKLTGLLTPQPAPVLASLALTMGVGAVVFWFWDPLHRLLEVPMSRAARYGMAAFYDRSLRWLPRVAATCTRTLQHGHLPLYVATAVAASTLAIAALVLGGPSGIALPAFEHGPMGAAGGCALVVVGAVAAARLRERLSMLLASGLVGYGSAVIFLFAGAPDVALTQFMVETVFVIVAAAVLLAFQRRGRDHSVTEPTLRPGALLLSAAFATVMLLLVLAATAGPIDGQLARFFGDRSLLDAHGRNVVNVILVDFRALDTLGEVTVVLMSLLAAVPMLEKLSKSPPSGPPTLILEQVAGPLYVLILVTAAAVLLRGHNEPGGGFVGGLMAVTATVLWATARGSEAARRRLPLGSPVRLAAFGVLLAAVSGLPAWTERLAYLTHWWGTLPGGVAISTVLLFDLGVFLCVWGALGGYALGLIDADVPEHQRRREAA
ncbi:MAG: hydrogen gas-evolving membrane-bound hydrogenase subunit E [Candidatus Binatia bacterium]